MEAMETKNLLIRETEFEDCSLFAEWECDPQVTKFLSFDENRDYKQIVEEWFLNKQDRTKMQFTVVGKAEKRPIGRILITRLDRDADSLDVTKFYLEPQSQGKGYGTEILTELLEYCFVFLHMERVTLDHYTGNKGAASLYSKIGFQQEGIARNACKKDGRYYDLHLMSMLRTEFFERVHCDE